MTDKLTHWKKLTNPDYLGAYAFDPGQEMIVTIKSVKNEMVTGTDGKKEECIVARFYENVKPLILNKTNCKMIAKLYKTAYIEKWQGRKIQLHVEKVKAFGDITEAVRVMKVIPHVDNINLKCMECGAEIKGYGDMTAEQMEKYTYRKYSKALCCECATKAAQAETTKDVLGGTENENN